MIIQHNMPAINAHRQMGINTNNIAKSLEKLSSGYRINRAGDDAAGLAISEKMRGQISGLSQATRNSQDGISLVQTAEGNLQETHAILQRMRELSVQSANGTYDNKTDRHNLNKEVEALKSEIDRISSSAEFNGRKLLDGTMAGPEKAGYGNLGLGDKIPAGANVIGYANEADAIAANNAGIKIKADENVTLSFKSSAASSAADANTVSAKWNNGKLEITTIGGWDPDPDGNPDTDDGAAAAGAIDAADIQAAIDKALKEAGKNADISVEFTKSVTTDNAGVASLTGKDGTTVTLNTDIAKATAITGTNGKITAADIAKVTGDKNAKFIEGSDPKGKLVLQIGANGVADQRVSLEVGDMSTKGLKIDDISIATRTAANEAIDVIDTAINTVSSTRADLGALQNRLEHTINNLGVYNENLTAAESRIRDVDMAKEMMSFTKNQILQQASQAMLAQANALPQGVLQLLQ